MADNLQPDLPLRSPVAEAATANKSGIVLPPDNVEDATSALDAAFREQMGRDPNLIDNTPERDREKIEQEIKTASEIPDEESPEEPAPTGDEKPAGEEKPSGEEKPTPPAEDSTDDVLDKLLGKQTPPAEEPKPETPAEEPDPYKDLKLRADASERTKTTFEDLKRTAREREAKARQEAEAARKEAEAARKEAAEAKTKLEEAAKKTVAPEVEQELKELREFRATYAAEQDPEFNKKFNERRERNNSTIFETLKRNGLKDDVLNQLKALPYEQQVDQITRWADKLQGRDKLAVTGRLADNEIIEADRQAALAEVKAKAAEIVAKKADTTKQDQEAFVQEAVATLKPVLPQLTFLHPKEIPATATPKEKADLEKHNAAAVEAQKLLLGFLQDNSPRSRSLLALAGVLAPRYRAELQQVKTELEAARKELTSIKEAGRLSKTSRSSGTAAAAAPKIDIYETNAEDAMEQAWKAMQS